MTDNDPPARRSHRLLGWVGVPAAMIVVGLAIGEWTGWPILRTPLQHALTKAAQVPVVLDGEFDARFIWRPHLQVGHLNVGAAPGVEGKDMQAPHLLDAHDIDLRWGWLDLWHWRRGGPLRLKRLHAAALDARLLRDADGHASWQIGGSPPTPEKGKDAATLPQFGSLQIAEGEIVFDDKLLDTALRVDIHGGEGSGAERSGYRATVKGRWQKLPMDLKITSGAVLPLLADDRVGDADGSSALDFSVKGTAGAATISFDGHAAAVFGARDLDGALVFSGPSLAQVGAPLGLTLPATPPFKLSGHLSHQGGIWHLKADSATMGSSRLDGDFRFDGNQKPPQLSGRLGGARLALADLGPAVGAPTSSAASGETKPKPSRQKKAGGRVLPDKHFDLPSLRAMNADVQVAIDELDLGSSSLAPLRHLKTHLTLTDSVLKLNDVSAVVAGGDFNGSTELDARNKEARWALDMRLSTVDVAAWLRGLQAGSATAPPPAATDTSAVVAERKQARTGGDQAVKSYLTGALTGRVKATGRGNSTSEILGRIDGTASFLLRDGSISHLVTEGVDLDIAQALGVLVKGDTPLPLRCARVDLKATDGLVKIQRAVADNRDSTIRVAGTINLQDEKLALKAQSKPKDFSPLSLSTPVTVGGTLGSPTVGIDAKALGVKVIGAAVLAAVAAPVAAVLPFIEFPSEKEKGDVCADPGPAAAASAASAAPSR